MDVTASKIDFLLSYYFLQNFQTLYKIFMSFCIKVSEIQSVSVSDVLRALNFKRVFLKIVFSKLAVKSSLKLTPKLNSFQLISKRRKITYTIFH